MPIHCPVELRPLSDDTFASVDHLVMGCCYASQNTLGHLCDERVYENDVAARLRSEGVHAVHTQLPVTLTHESFSKQYMLDLVVCRMLYEFKSVTALTPEHDAQAIHYAALTGTDRVKVVNFRSEKVVGRLLRSPLWRVDRRQFRVMHDRWEPLSDTCVDLRARLHALLLDWGTFLEAGLFEQALAHFHGGDSRGARRLPLTRDGIELGTHRVTCHAARVGFVVTAFVGQTAAAHESQLRRLLRCLPLDGLQWMNLDHSLLHLVTLRNDRGMEARQVTRNTVDST